MEKPPVEGVRRNHMVSLKLESKTITDWSVPYSGCQEEGRGALEIDGEISDVIVRYYSVQRMRFEKQRHFAEVIVNKKDKFIIDGVEIGDLVDWITGTVLTILECRKKMRQANTGLKLVKK